jgi:CBS domain-containing protein
MYTISTLGEEPKMKVRDIMITKVFTVKPSNTVKELLHILNFNRIGSVPVVDDKDHLVGMLSDGDVLRYLAPKPLGIAGLVYIIEDGELEDVIHEKLDTPVKDIMTKRNILYVSPDEEFDKTIRLLSRHHFKKLPVVNGAGRVIGVLSRGDIINNISKKIISF